MDCGLGLECGHNNKTSFSSLFSSLFLSSSLSYSLSLPPFLIPWDSGDIHWDPPSLGFPPDFPSLTSSSITYSSIHILFFSHISRNRKRKHNPSHCVQTTSTGHVRSGSVLAWYPPDRLWAFPLTTYYHSMWWSWQWYDPFRRDGLGYSKGTATNWLMPS